MKWTHLVFMAVALLVICGGTSATFADWPTNGQTVCTAANLQSNVRVASDGNGGSIMTWIDRRTGNDYWAIYAQKLDEDGNALWAANGVIIRSDSYYYEIGELVIASDGEGGAIIAWADPRNYLSYGMDMYAQRVGVDGTVKWTANGVRISSLDGDETAPAIVPDQTGGAIIAYNCFPYGWMRAQRINGSGTVLWQTNGIIVSWDTDSYNSIGLMPNGAGGAYLAWAENDTTETDVYMQRVSPAGTLDWYTTPICIATGNQLFPQLVSDGSGGAIIAWYDTRGGVNDHYQIYAQKVDTSGQVQWTSNGAEVASLYDYHLIGVNNTEMCADGLGGAIIAWKQDYSSEHGDIYAQRINGNGQLVWTSGGVAICDDSQSGNYDQRGTRIAPDALGGALIIWEDARNGSDLYGQKVDSVGDVAWASNGSPLCTASGSQGAATIIAGGMFAWIDNRNASSDIYALKVASGSEPTIPPCTVTYQFYDTYLDQLFDPDDPNHTPFLLACPQGDSSSIDYLVVNVDFVDAYMTRDIAASEITIDKPTTLPIKFFYDGVICADSAATDANGYATTITVEMIGGANDSCINCTPPSSPSDVPVRLNGELIGTVNDLRVRGYDLTNDGHVNISDLVPFNSSYYKCYGQAGFNQCCDFNADNCCSLSDLSMFGHHYQHAHEGSSYYMVAGKPLRSDMDVALRIEAGSMKDAVGTVRAVVRLENAMNLSAAAIGFDIRRASMKFVGWEPAADFDGTVMVTPQMDDAGIIFVAISGMERIASGSVDIGTLVFAADNGGIGVSSESVSLAFGDVLDTKGRIMTIGSLDVEQGAPVLRNVLSSNYPNPFNPTTMIEYSIANDSPVNLSIYNVNGQLIRTLVNELQKSNTYLAIWDGKDSRGKSVESGIYFSRIVAGNFEQSKKLILLR